MVSIEVDRLDLFLLAYCCSMFRIFILIAFLLPAMMLSLYSALLFIFIFISISIILLSCTSWSYFVSSMVIYAVLFLRCFRSAIWGLKLALIAFLIFILGSIFISIVFTFSSSLHDSISTPDYLFSNPTP